MGSDQHYSLRWNDYTVKIVTAFQSLRDEEDFVDVTVACDGHSYSAHKMVLSACSPYFRVLLRANPCQHPIVILKDVGHTEMERLLEFMYNGEVSIAQDQLAAFLKTAENLKIRGLAGNSDDMEQFQRADISYNYNSRCSMGGGGTSGRSSPSVSYAPSQASKDDELTTDVPSGYLSRNPDSPPSKRRKRSSAPAASHSDANAASHSKECVVSESGVEVSGSSASDGCGIVGAQGSGPNDSDDPRQECRELKTEPQDPILDVYAEGPDLGSDPQGQQHQTGDPLDTRSSVMYPLAMPGPSGTLGGQDTSQEPGGGNVEERLEIEQHEVFGNFSLSKVEKTELTDSEWGLNQSLNYIEEDLPLAEHTFSQNMPESTQNNHGALRDEWTYNTTVQKNYTHSQHGNISAASPSSSLMWDIPNVNFASLSSTVSVTPCFNPSQNTTPNWLNWADSFEVPWAKMPATLMKAVREGKRPEPPERRLFVRIVVDEMRQQCPNPPKRECEVIVKAIIKSNSRSFADFSDEGEFIGSGHHSLLRQIKSRIENLNRNNSFGRLRAKKTPRTDDSENQELGQLQSKKSQSPVDTYGCVNWQPTTLPEEETEETLEAKRVYMVELYSREGHSGTDKNLIDELMKVTYYAQRCTINANPTPPVNEIITQWPYLSLQKYMDEHFKELTKIALYSRLQDTLVRKSPRILKYFRSLQNLKPATQEVIDELTTTSEDVIAPGAILILMTHFHEKIDSIFILADVKATKADIESSLDLPDTPRLIVQGDSILHGVKWMLSIEGKVICELTSLDSNFITGLALLFASYYNFNHQYEEGASLTLEFIQRYLVGINPETGTKCAQYTAISKITGKRVMRRREAINANVLTLMNRINSI